MQGTDLPRTKVRQPFLPLSQPQAQGRRPRSAKTPSAEYAAQLTGHKTVGSFRGYAEACEDVQGKMARSALTGAAFSVASTSTSSSTNSAPTGVAYAL